VRARRRGRARPGRARRTRAPARCWSRFRSAWSTSPSRRAGFASRVASRVGVLGVGRRLLPCREALRASRGAARAAPRTPVRQHVRAPASGAAAGGAGGAGRVGAEFRPKRHTPLAAPCSSACARRGAPPKRGPRQAQNAPAQTGNATAQTRNAPAQDVVDLLSGTKGLLPPALAARLCAHALPGVPTMPLRVRNELANAALQYTAVPEAEQLLAAIDAKVRPAARDRV
jgi:hypothetical protein